MIEGGGDDPVGPQPVTARRLPGPHCVLLVVGDDLVDSCRVRVTDLAGDVRVAERPQHADRLRWPQRQVVAGSELLLLTARLEPDQLRPRHPPRHRPHRLGRLRVGFRVASPLAEQVLLRRRDLVIGSGIELFAIALTILQQPTHIPLGHPEVRRGLQHVEGLLRIDRRALIRLCRLSMDQLLATERITTSEHRPELLRIHPPRRDRSPAPASQPTDLRSPRGPCSSPRPTTRPHRCSTRPHLARAVRCSAPATPLEPTRPPKRVESCACRARAPDHEPPQRGRANVAEGRRIRTPQR